MSGAAREYRFRPCCATPFTQREQHGLPRLVCTGCGFVFWRNPVVGVAVIVRRDEAILLGRRARGAYAGQWCIPCGYVEYDEDVRTAAVREFAEETGLVVQLDGVRAVHSNFHNPAQHSVGIWFDGRVTGGALCAGDDLDAVAWFDRDTLPAAIAFPTDRLVLSELFDASCRDGNG